MAIYIGPDGAIYNHAIPGGTPVNNGAIPPPPVSRGTRNTPTPPPRPYNPEPSAGFGRKFFFWIITMAISLYLGHYLGTFLGATVLADAGTDGFLGAIIEILASACPILMLVIAAITCLVSGVDLGEDHNYNLWGLILTILSVCGVCAISAIVLVLAPYGLAFLGYLLVFCLIIGVIAGICGGG